VHAGEQRIVLGPQSVHEQRTGGQVPGRRTIALMKRQMASQLDHADVVRVVVEFKLGVGGDTHWSDPLANLELTIDAQRAAQAAIHRLAHEFAGGRWVLTGGGGYEHVHVVPRSWTHLLFEAAGRPLDPASATPQLWREYVSCVTGRTAPERMTEGAFGVFPSFEGGYDPADAVDQSIMAARKAVFPLHGLMP